LALSVGVFDRRQLVEVSLDARGELLRLGPQELQLALLARTLSPVPGFAPEPRPEPRPLGTEHCRHGADQPGDHQPAHGRILPGCAVLDSTGVSPLLRLCILAGLAALALPGHASAGTET